MKNTTLKKSNLKVSVIGLGTNAVGGHNLFQNLNEEDGKDFVRAAIKQSALTLSIQRIFMVLVVLKN